MKTSPVLAIIFMMAAFIHSATAQDTSLTIRRYYAELRVGIRYVSGPSEGQAEIIGGFDSVSYDNLEHYSPGFKSTSAFSLVFGYDTRKRFRFQGHVGYFRQEMALVETLWRDECRFFTTDRFFIKGTGLFDLLNQGDKLPVTLSSGLSIGTTFQLYGETDTAAANRFGIAGVRPGTELFAGIEVALDLSIGKSGFYALAGCSFTLPWVIGSAGYIEMQQGAPYEAERSAIIMHSIAGEVGVGFRIGK